MMRGLLLAIAVLAVARLGFNEYLDRTAKTAVIINAYREHAIAACQQQAGNVALSEAWTKPATLQLTVGKRDLDVYVWQTNHRLWNARFRNAYLYLTLSKTAAHIYCEYDINNDIASVHRAGTLSKTTTSG